MSIYGNTTIEKLENLGEKRNAAFYRMLDTVISLATGALSLTLAFNDRLSGGHFAHVWMLKYAWGLFAVCILSGIWARLAEPYVFHKLIERINEETELPGAAPLQSQFLCGLACFAAFVIATGLLAIYGVLNI